MTQQEINNYLNSNDRLLFPAIDYANDIIGKPITDDVFGGVQAVYDKLTNYAKRIVRVQADNRMSEIKSMAALLATEITADTEADITDAVIAGLLPDAFKALAGVVYEETQLDSTITSDWSAGIWVNAGDVIYENDIRYIVNQSHKTQTGWEPSNAPALFRQATIDETTGYPIWVQPTGAQDAYAAGTIVTHNGSNWQSDVDANVWEPGVFGWTEVV